MDICPDKSTASPEPAAAQETATTGATKPDPDWDKLVKGARRPAEEPVPAGATPAAKTEPVAAPATTGDRSPWDAITQKDLPNYLEVERAFCRLSGKSTRDMYQELGVPSRNYATIKVWDAWLTLKERFAPKR